MMQPGYRPKVRDRLRLPELVPWRIPLAETPPVRAVRASPLVLVYGFAALIVIGTVLLALPVSNNFGRWASFTDALFTATSAVCVTGLVVVDTLNHWSLFGQIVILVLIQIGGFGFMTSTTILLLALGRRIGLRERLLIGESMGLSRLGGLLWVVGGMAIFTVLAESIGATVFYFHFANEFSFETAIWKSIFQAVSAFNNAGFDLFGGFRSLTRYSGDYLVVLITAALVILGGISFLVLQDVFRTFSVKKLSVDSKLVLSMTALLLVFGMLIVLATEWNNDNTLGPMPFPEKLLNAFFHSVTPRTAGFSTLSMATMADYTLFFTMLLMFVGGASGSTAGGIKVNTIGLIIATVWSSIRGKEYPGVFNREFMNQQIFRALAVIALSMAFMSLVVFLLTITEGFRFLTLLFETVSAFGTVGLSTGITPSLSLPGRLLITITMFVGRLGPLTLTLALVRRQQPTRYRYPKEIVRIG